jgi:hypothetical protein
MNMFSKKEIVSIAICWIVSVILAMGIAAAFTPPPWVSFLLGVVFGSIGFNVGLIIGNLDILFK